MDTGSLLEENAKLKKALAGVMPFVGLPAYGASWATPEAKSRNQEMCEQAFDFASSCFPDCCIVFPDGTHRLCSENELRSPGGAPLASRSEQFINSPPVYHDEAACRKPLRVHRLVLRRTPDYRHGCAAGPNRHIDGRWPSAHEPSRLGSR